MLTIAFALIFLGAIAALAYWLPRALAGSQVDAAAQLAERNAAMERRLQGLNETMDRRLAELDTKVDRRLESASKTTTQVHERLVKLDEANAQMLERAKELSRLERALRRRDSRQPDGSGRCKVSARQLRTPRRGARHRRARPPRKGVRARRQGP